MNTRNNCQGVRQTALEKRNGGPLENWDILKGCFPRGTLPSDLDGIIEINGQFLVIETKPDTQEIRKNGGQFRMLKQLSLLPNITVAVVLMHGHGDKRMPVAMTHGSKATNGINLNDMAFRPITLDDLRTFARLWARTAEGNMDMRLSA